MSVCMYILRDVIQHLIFRLKLFPDIQKVKLKNENFILSKTQRSKKYSI